MQQEDRNYSLTEMSRIDIVSKFETQQKGNHSQTKELRTGIVSS